MDSEWRPHARKIAYAICLAADERFAESIEILQETDRDVTGKNKDKNEDEEWKHIPLYLFTIHLLKNSDKSTIQNTFEEFIERNSEYPEYIVNRTLEFLYSLIKTPDLLKEGHVITGVLLEQEFLSNRKDDSKITMDKAASVKDMHAQSLKHSGRKAEAKDIFKDIYEEYFPHNLASANAAINYAMLDYEINQNKKLALDILDSVLLNAPQYPRIIGYARMCHQYISNQ